MDTGTPCSRIIPRIYNQHNSSVKVIHTARKCVDLVSQPTITHTASCLRGVCGKWVTMWYHFHGPIRLADLNRVWDALLSLNHSKSNLCRSDFNLGQAHKRLHLTKCIYSEGILCLFKLIYKIDIQSSKCFSKISKFKKKIWNECTCRSILRNFFFMTRRSSILGPLSITIYHSIPAHW